MTKATRPHLPGLLLIALVATAGCSVPGASAGTSEPTTTSNSTAASRLTPLTHAGRVKAVATIKRLPTKGRGPMTGYSRAQFGAPWSDDATGVLWAGNQCRTRDDVLRRDMDGVKLRGKCTVIAGHYTDPYTGQVVKFSKSKAYESPIDHLLPLGFSWQMGAARWPASKRLRLANDPLNLITTTEKINSAKGDSDPASYLPPNKKIRCAYVDRFALVATKYDLPVTPADKVIMLAQCGT